MKLPLLLAGLLVAISVWPVHGAHNFTASSGYAATTNVPVTAPPFTLACWFKAATVTTTYNPLNLAVGSGNTRFFAIRVRGDVAGDPVEARTLNNSTSENAAAQSSTGYSAGTWHHVVGVFASSTSRSVYLDGGSKGTNTTSVTSPTPDLLSMHAIVSSGSTVIDVNHLDIAECGVWTVGLSDEEAATLAEGYPPECVRRADLVAYWPLVNDSASVKDHFHPIDSRATLNGTTAASEHPPIIPCK